MATKGYDISNLAAYIKQNADVILKDSIFGDAEGDSVSKMRKQTGVKGTEKLHILDVTPALQDGSACGFSAKGSTVFSDRDIVTKVIKVQDEFCALDLVGRFAESLVTINADNDSVPFEAEIMDEVAKGIHKQVEKAIWQGNTGLGVKGLLEIAGNGGADSASTINVSIASGTSIYDAVKQVYMAMTDELIDNGGFIALSPANFRKFTQELLEKNLYHYPSAQNENAKSFILPGTDVEVREVKGMTGVNDKIYASSWENLVYGCDLLSDSETVKGWFSDDDELFKYTVRFNFGVNTLFPDEVVLGVIAGA